MVLFFRHFHFRCDWIFVWDTSGFGISVALVSAFGHSPNEASNCKGRKHLAKTKIVSMTLWIGVNLFHFLIKKNWTSNDIMAREWRIYVIYTEYLGAYTHTHTHTHTQAVKDLLKASEWKYTELNITNGLIYWEDLEQSKGLPDWRPMVLYIFFKQFLYCTTLNKSVMWQLLRSCK